MRKGTYHSGVSHKGSHFEVTHIVNELKSRLDSVDVEMKVPRSALTSVCACACGSVTIHCGLLVESLWVYDYFQQASSSGRLPGDPLKKSLAYL
jgi:hypothetical protein